MANFTNFKKYTNNPLDLPLYGANGVVHPDVLYFPDSMDGYKYWMVYTPYPPGSKEIPTIVRSNDGDNWTNTGISNPVLSLGTDEEVPDPDFLYVSIYSKWFMVYARKHSDTSRQIYLAYSTDGKSWTEKGILIDGSASYEKDGNGDPQLSTSTLIFEDGWFYVWYSAPNGAALVNNQQHICLAKFQWNNSTNAVENFSREGSNPILYPSADATFKHGLGHPDVSFYDNVYYMYAVRELAGSVAYEVALFTSTNKTSWTNKGKVLSLGSSGDWDERYIYRTSTITDGVGGVQLFLGENIVYYSAYNSGGNPRIGRATSCESEGGGSSGWLSGWKKRIKLTLDHTDIDATLPNFPVLVYLSTSSGRTPTDVSCVFDELTSTNEHAWLWVKVPDISNTADTDDSSQSNNTAYVGDPSDAVVHNVWDASKLAAEGLMISFAHTFDMKAWIFRLANVVGSRETHGILVDFIEKLKTNPRVLKILGDGKQEKSYLLMNECVDAMFYAVENAKGKNRVNIYNIGSNDQISVRKIAQILVEELELKNIEFKYTGGERGWKGDVPRMMLSVKKINDLGWEAKHSSEEAIRKVAKLLSKNLLSGKRWR